MSDLLVDKNGAEEDAEFVDKWRGNLTVTGDFEQIDRLGTAKAQVARNKVARETYGWGDENDNTFDAVVPPRFVKPTVEASADDADGTTSAAATADDGADDNAAASSDGAAADDANQAGN